MKKTSSSNFINEQYLLSECEVNYTLSLISGRWKLQLLLLIMDGTNSFGKIQAALPNIAHQVLGRQVKQLEQDGLVIKVENEQRLKRIDYHLTEKAKTLEPVIRGLCEWGKINIPACIKESKMG